MSMQLSALLCLNAPHNIIKNIIRATGVMSSENWTQAMDLLTK